MRGLLLSALITAVLACVAGAATVMVYPGFEHSWVNNDYYGGGSDYSRLAPAGDPLPFGAFYGQTGYEGSTTSSTHPGQCWLGTDYIDVSPTESYSLDNVLCRNITKLSYSTYLKWAGVDDTHPAKQPWQLQFSIRKTGPTDPNFRWMMFRPMGLLGGAASIPDARYERWLTWDCLSADGVWYDAIGSASSAVGNWAFYFDAAAGKYKNAPLAVPCDTNPNQGWAPTSSCDTAQTPPRWTFYTGTGKCLSFQMGARQQIANIFGQTAYAWWFESYNSRCFLDNFVIEAQIPQGNIIIPETTFDFELDPPSNHWDSGLGLNNRSASVDWIIQRSRYQYWYVVWGKVIEEGFNLGTSFKIDDGSGRPITVYSDSGTPSPGWYVRVRGQLNKSPLPAQGPQELVCPPGEPVTLYPTE